MPQDNWEKKTQYKEMLSFRFSERYRRFLNFIFQRASD